MNSRVDYAIAPRGFLQNAMCHSLITDEENLYIIRVSRGWKVGFAPMGALESTVANAVVARMLKRAAAATQELTSSNYREMIGSKGSLLIPLSAVRKVEFKSPPGTLRIWGNGKKFKFRFEASETGAFGEFAHALQARIGGQA